MRDLLTAWVPYGMGLGWGVFTLVDELVKQRRERLRRERERGTLAP